MVLKHISWEQKSGGEKEEKCWVQSVLKVFYYYFCHYYYYYTHEVSLMGHNMVKLKHWEHSVGKEQSKPECQFCGCWITNSWTSYSLIWEVEIIIPSPWGPNDTVNTMCFEKHELWVKDYKIELRYYVVFLKVF